jgi:hypothetical protein
LPEFKAVGRFKPEAYRVYVEDLNLPANAGIGQEALFLEVHAIR